MPYTIFEKKSTRIGTPAITVLTNGRMALNSSATQLMRANAVEQVLLLWDDQNRKGALRPISKKDARAYRVTYAGPSKSSSSFSAKSFMDHIGWDLSEKRTVRASWNADEGLLEFEVPSEYLKEHSQRRLLPVESARKSR